jgi:hypothetical protein
VRTPDRYVELIKAGKSPTAAGEHLDDAARRFEALALSLRTPAGVPADALDDGDGALDGLVDWRDGRAVLTVRGRLLANEVTARLRSDGACGVPGTMPEMSQPAGVPFPLQDSPLSSDALAVALGAAPDAGR